MVRLEGLDAEIVGAKSGKEALLSMQSILSHLIIADLQVPVMNGFELICHLKSNSNTDSIPIMVVTCDNNRETVQKSFQLGAQDFIPKSILGADILLRAKRLIGYL